MKDLPKISEAEWRIMRVLWTRSPLTANEVVESLHAHSDWNHRTIKTLLNRLVKKKALITQKQGRQFLYHPAVSEDQILRTERTSFLKRAYNGAVMPMLAAFLEEEDLSTDDIDRLKSILKQREGK